MKCVTCKTDFEGSWTGDCPECERRILAKWAARPLSTEAKPGSLHPDGCAARWSVKPIFAWYDLWVGIFWDSRKRKLYILPLPCVGVVIEIPMRHNAPR